MKEHDLESSISSSPKQICEMFQTSTAASTDNNEIFRTSSQPARIRILENFIVIWLDSNIDHSDEDTRNTTIMYLQGIVNLIKIFTDSDKCIDFLTDIKNEKVFMIISDDLGQEILSRILDIPQLHSVYIFRNHQTTHEQWINESKKVKGFFTRIESLYDTLKQNIYRSDIDLTPIGIISTNTFTNLDELDPSFMYSQLLKEIIVDMENDESSKERFIHFYRQHYLDDDVMLKKIDQFEQNYESSTPIWWYTKESFIYSTLNKALRTHDIETIFKMEFFIRNLHRQIEQLHLEKQPSTAMVLYRGQGLSNDDLMKIQNTKGGLLSFSNFLSTSENREVSLMFAESARADPDLTGVLFTMTVDPSTSSTPFASLKDISYYAEVEMEILFSMHAVFRIGEAEQIEDRLWQVNLVLTSDTDQQLKDLADYMRTELGNKQGWYRMLKLMCIMSKSELYFEVWRLVVDTTFKCDLESFVTMLNDQEKLATFVTNTLKHAAGVYFFRAHCKNAPSELRREIEQESLPSNHSELATAHPEPDGTCDWMKDCESALSCYKKVLEIQEEYLPSNYLELATTYQNISKTYQYMGDYSTALAYLEKLLEIQQTSCPDGLSQLAVTYSNIGKIYQSMEDYTTALSYFEKTLGIREQSLPPNHPDLATTYYNIGKIHQSMKNYSTALSHFEKTLNIQEKSLPFGHSDLDITYNSIGKVYQSMEDYPTAFRYFEKTKERDAAYIIAQFDLLMKEFETISKD